MAKYPTRKRIFDLVGEAQKNPDGRSRQLELQSCQPGEQVKLVREPQNPYDEFAIAVYSNRSVQIGYMRKEHAKEVAPALDASRNHEAIITELTGGLPDYPNFGCKIGITWEGQRPLNSSPIRPEQSLYGGGALKKAHGFWQRLFS